MIVRVSRLLAVLALSGCGRIHYDPGVDAADPVADTAPGVGGQGAAATGGAPGRDAGGAGDAGDDDRDAGAGDGDPGCRGGEFAPPALVPIDGLAPDLYTARPIGPTLLMLSQTRGDPFYDEDAWVLSRGSGAPLRFERPVRLAPVTGPGFDGSPFATGDGLELYFSSARPGAVGNRDVWVTRRAQPSGGWADPVVLVEIDSHSNEQSPSLTGDGLQIFFESDRPGGPGKEDIYTATRATRNAAFAAPVRVAALASTDKDEAPFVSSDGLAIYFSSDRPGGRGGLDLWRATRASRTAPFAAPVALDGVNSPEHDEDPSISADGSELYFSSGRSGKGVLIYRAVRCP